MVKKINFCRQTTSFVVSYVCQFFEPDVPSVYYFGAQLLQPPVDLTSVQRRQITTMRVQECSTLVGLLALPRLPQVLQEIPLTRIKPRERSRRLLDAPSRVSTTVPALPTLGLRDVTVVH